MLDIVSTFMLTTRFFMGGGSVLKVQLLLRCFARSGSKCCVSCTFRSISSNPVSSDV